MWCGHPNDGEVYDKVDNKNGKEYNKDYYRNKNKDNKENNNKDKN